MQQLDLKPVVLFIGNYGSGKTEVSVNFAVNRRAAGQQVQIADLDVVNPYFRSREVRDLLEAKGIEVILPDQQLMNADLPIVVPQIRGLIKQPKGTAILDVGGDDVGATVLGSLHDELSTSPHDMLQVVNISRPFTETADDTLIITREIEAAGRLKVTGIIGNSHLMDHTTVETIYRGYEYTMQVANSLNLPVRFITCEARLMDELRTEEFDCPVLPIERQMLPPWRRRNKLGSQNFLLS